MIFNLDSGGGKMAEDKVEFSGSKLWYQDSATGDWELALLSSGTLRFKATVGNVDIFMVGPGDNGSSGRSNSASDVYGGDGGNGGEIVNQSSRLNLGRRYTVTIGDPGEVTRLTDAINVDISAQSGAGVVGGKGGHVLNNAQARYGPNKDGLNLDGALAFNGDNTMISSLTGTKFGAGGGGARCSAYYSNNYYPSSGGSTSGGDTGGGSGGGADSAGNSATPNTGSGGGGGGDYGGASYSGGAGATGIVMIRNHRG